MPQNINLVVDFVGDGGTRTRLISCVKSPKIHKPLMAHIIHIELLMSLIL